MDNKPEEQEVSTEAQRQALDAMSADLVSKLNRMIEEQNARVQEFATQYPQAAATESEPVTYHAPRPEPPRPTHSVTPPPAVKPSPEAPPPARPQRHVPAAKTKSTPPDAGKGENSIGCGKLVFIIAVIVILLRCCN